MIKNFSTINKKSKFMEVLSRDDLVGHAIATSISVGGITLMILIYLM